jgi:hypothetical protein
VSLDPVYHPLFLCSDQILIKANKIIGDETHIPSGISIRLREQENRDHTPADFDGRTDQQRKDLTMNMPTMISEDMRLTL